MKSLSTDISPRRNYAWVIAVLLGMGSLGIAGCHPSASDENAKASDSSQPDSKEAGDGLTLTAEQIEKLDVTTSPARALEYSAEIAGYGLIIPHDAIATAVAELVTAHAAQEQSRAAAERAQRLAGTPGAMSADAVETSKRQVATDSAALSLAQHRLSAVIGEGPPGRIPADSTLQDLASGKIKLVRATFPLGAIQGPVPTALRAAPLAGAASGWTLRPVWAAPADASVPGRSFFALLKASDAGEGERLLIWAPGRGPVTPGVVVPASALVISAGRYWCYVEQKPGVYARREVPTDRPLDDGYVVTAGISPGDKIVTSAAGLLLAREINPSTEAD